MCCHHGRVTLSKRSIYSVLYHLIVRNKLTSINQSIKPDPNSIIITMSFPLRPLQLQCERCASIIESMPKFLTSLETFPAAAASSSALHARSQIEHLDTKYGLRLSLENGQIKSVRIVNTPFQPASDSPTTGSHTDDSLTPDTHTTIVNSKVPLPPQPPKPRYSYRLFPDWQTSYLGTMPPPRTPLQTATCTSTRTTSQPTTRSCALTTSPGRRFTSPLSKGKAAISALRWRCSPTRSSALHGRWKGV